MRTVASINYLKIFGDYPKTKTAQVVMWLPVLVCIDGIAATCSIKLKTLGALGCQVRVMLSPFSSRAHRSAPAVG